MQQIKLIEYQFIFISGSIGAGKSTVIDKLMDVYDNKPFLVKEYIDYDPEGEQKLNQFLKNEMPAFEFQKYVVDCVFSQFVDFLNNYSNQTNIIIWERHPMESLIFGAQKLSFPEMKMLYHYIHNLCYNFGIPLPNECTFINIKNSDHKLDHSCSYIEKICDKIFDVKKSNMNLLIHLNVDKIDQTKRLMKRARYSDRGYLMDSGMEYLDKINYAYSKMPSISYEITPEKFFLFYKYKK